MITIERRTGISFACVAVWIFIAVTAGLSVTSQDGKFALCTALNFIAGAGCIVAALASLRREPYARVATGVNVTLAVFSVLATVAVLS